MAKRTTKRITAEERERIKQLQAYIERQHQASFRPLKKTKYTLDSTPEVPVTQVLPVLKMIRQAQGQSLTDLSKLTGMRVESLSRLENLINTNPQLETLIRYAEALGKKLMIKIVDV